MKRSITVEVVVGGRRQDLWCADCHSSARFELDLFTMTANGMTPLTTVRQCMTCDYPQTDDGTLG